MQAGCEGREVKSVLFVWIVFLQVPAVYAVLYGGGELYGIHAFSAERQRTPQDLHHGEELATKQII